MSVITGTCEAISSKKVGKGFLYGVKVDGQWYNCGFKKPPFDKGDDVSFTVGKNDKGYDEATFSEGSKTSKGEAKPAATKVSSSFNRDFETSEERAKKQVYIIRQSSLERACNIVLATSTKGKVDTDEILQLSEKFVGYVLNGYGVSGIKEMEDDIPL
jgi:hypothetical protein